MHILYTIICSSYNIISLTPGALIPPMPNLHLLMMPCYIMLTMTCLLSEFGLLSVCVLAGRGWHDWCLLWGVVWRGQSACDCVWGVETGDWHVDVGVLLDGTCCVEWCTRLLLLLRLCVVLTLFYNPDYG